MGQVESPSKTRRWTLLQYARYYLGGLLGLALMVAGVYHSGAGKFIPPQKELIRATLLFVVGIGIVIYSFLAVPEQDRRSRAWEPIVTALVTVGSCAILMPVFYSARVAAARTACVSNMKSIVTGLMIYASDSDDKLPPAGHWRSAIDYAMAEKDLRCRESKAVSSYSFNQAFSSSSLSTIEVPAFSILVFESDSDNSNAAGGESQFLPRHNEMGAVGYATGTARLVKPDSPELRWRR